jgi:squalene synthase HpnC
LALHIFVMHLPVNLEIAKELPPSGSSVQQAEQYTRWLATHHYENFIVASVFLPRRLRQHFYNVYAYCRWADDLGDEVPDRSTALELLNWWDAGLRQCYAGTATHPVFVALAGTIEKFEIPIEPFSALLTAFRQDQTVRRYAAWDAVIDYCRYSANPVGRLVLYLCGYKDRERQTLSDFTCTALQLANFWQDVSRDLDKDRIYIPADLMAAHGVEAEDLFARRFDNRYASLMRILVDRTRELFEKGLPIVQCVAPNVRIDLELFSRGGLAVLDAIESIGYNTLQQRPSLTGATKLKLIGRALGEHALTYARR